LFLTQSRIDVIKKCSKGLVTRC